MKPHTPIPFTLNSGNIKKDIKAIKNWVEADLKYQVWSLNTKTPARPTDKRLVDDCIPPKRKLPK